MSDDTQDLLEFGSIDIFYIVWVANNHPYYLSDMTDDFQQINWTRDRSNAFYFYTEKEASKHAELISRQRPGVGVITGEIDILDEIDLDLMP